MKRFQRTCFIWDFSDLAGDLQNVTVDFEDAKLLIKEIKFISMRGELKMYLTVYRKEAAKKYQPLNTEHQRSIQFLRDLLDKMHSGSRLVGGRSFNNNMGILSYLVKGRRDVPTNEVVLQIFDEIAAAVQRPKLLEETFLWFDVYQQASVECKRKDRDDPSIVPYGEYLILKRRGFLEE